MSNLTVVQPTSYAVSDVQTMANCIAKSGLFGIKDQSQAMALMFIAQAEGRHPASVANDYDIIQGRPAIKSMSALARFQAAGGRIQWTERSDKACAAKFVHALGGELEIRWDMARAQAAGLTGKDNWRKFPAQMLAARVVAEGVRACFPACLNGFYLSEEVADFAPTTTAIQEAQEVRTEPEKPSESRIASMVSAFATINVTKEQIEEWLGHAIIDTDAHEITELSGIYTTIKSGAKVSEFFGKEEPAEAINVAPVVVHVQAPELTNDELF